MPQTDGLGFSIKNVIGLLLQPKATQNFRGALGTRVNGAQTECANAQKPTARHDPIWFESPQT
jgi:hypothetical protein